MFFLPTNLCNHLGSICKSRLTLNIKENVHPSFRLCVLLIFSMFLALSVSYPILSFKYIWALPICCKCQVMDSKCPYDLANWYSQRNRFAWSFWWRWYKWWLLTKMHKMLHVHVAIFLTKESTLVLLGCCSFDYVLNLLVLNYSKVHHDHTSSTLNLNHDGPTCKICPDISVILHAWLENLISISVQIMLFQAWV